MEVTCDLAVYTAASTSLRRLEEVHVGKISIKFCEVLCEVVCTFVNIDILAMGHCVFGKEQLFRGNNLRYGRLHFGEHFLRRL